MEARGTGACLGAPPPRAWRRRYRILTQSHASCDPPGEPTTLVVIEPVFGNVPQARDGVVPGCKRLAATGAQGDPADKAVRLVLAHRERGNADDVVNRVAHVGTVANTRSLPCGD